MHLSKLFFVFALAGANLFASDSAQEDHEAIEMGDEETTYSSDELRKERFYRAPIAWTSLIAILSITTIVADLVNMAASGEIGQAAYETGAFVFSALLGIMISDVVRKMPPVLPNQLAKRNIVTDPNKLGFVLYCQETACMLSAGYLLSATGRAAKNMIDSRREMLAKNQTIAPLFEGESPYVTCGSRMCAESCDVAMLHQQPTDVAVELSFIPKNNRTVEDGYFMFSSGSLDEQRADVHARLVAPIASQLQEHKNVDVDFWVDGERQSPEVLNNTIREICDTLKSNNVSIENLFLRDFRDIERIAENPDIFSVDTLVYHQADIARIEAGIYEIDVLGRKMVLHSDLDFRAFSMDEILTARNQRCINNNLFCNSEFGDKSVVHNGVIVFAKPDGKEGEWQKVAASLQKNLTDFSMDMIRVYKLGHEVRGLAENSGSDIDSFISNKSCTVDDLLRAFPTVRDHEGLKNIKDWPCSTAFQMDYSEEKTKGISELVYLQIWTWYSAQLGIDPYDYVKTNGEIRFDHHNAPDEWLSQLVADGKFEQLLVDNGFNDSWLTQWTSSYKSRAQKLLMHVPTIKLENEKLIWSLKDRKTFDETPRYLSGRKRLLDPMQIAALVRNNLPVYKEIYNEVRPPRAEASKTK